MSERVRVYGLLAVLAATAGGFWTYKTKPWGLFGASAKAADKDGKKQSEKKGEKDPTPVELVSVTRGAISAHIATTANLRALREIPVATQVEGVVQKVVAEEGDFVKANDVLCVLDDTPVKLRLELARQKLAQARLQMEKARVRQEKATAQIRHSKIELDRFEKAHKEGLVSEKEAATYRYRLEEQQHDERVSASETRELQHKVSELEAEIAQSELELSRTQIRAPFEGYITQRVVNLGQRVRVMDSTFQLASFAPLFADVFLSEREARAVRAGQPATVRLGADEAAAQTGVVERISPVVDQSTGTIKVTVRLNPGQGFRAGSFVRVEIRTDNKGDAVLIPKRALLEEDGQNFVFVADNGVAHRLKVTLGYENSSTVEVRSGVAPGQKVVVAGQGALKEGSKVKIIKG